MNHFYKKPVFYGLILCTAAIIFAGCVNLEKIVITNPDLDKVSDGTYRGQSKVGPVRVTLDVTVKDRTITDIVIVRHFNGRGKKAEAIIPRIINAQSLEVDTISGATGSSKAILQAAERALRSMTAQ
jgi:uncharacterized protein with FMN-binding domain